MIRIDEWVKTRKQNMEKKRERKDMEKQKSFDIAIEKINKEKRHQLAEKTNSIEFLGFDDTEYPMSIPYAALAQLALLSKNSNYIADFRINADPVYFMLRNDLKDYIQNENYTGIYEMKFKGIHYKDLTQGEDPSAVKYFRTSLMQQREVEASVALSIPTRASEDSDDWYVIGLSTDIKISYMATEEDDDYTTIKDVVVMVAREVFQRCLSCELATMYNVTDIPDDVLPNSFKYNAYDLVEEKQSICTSSTYTNRNVAIDNMISHD